MREILFRGKRLDNGQWVYGYLVKRPSAIQLPGYGGPWYIEVPPSDPEDAGGTYNVDSDTVGQYTGLSDSNGEKVFEGDIVKMHHFFENYDPWTLGVIEDEEVLDALIGIEQYGVSFETLDRKTSGYVVNYLEDPEAELEVIGNRWDHLELLEGATEK